MGLGLVFYLIIHLIVNSQATLWLGDDGIGFVRLVNLLESLPFLQVIEIVFIGIPLVVHAYWGVRRIFTSKVNVQKGAGDKPSLGYGRNRAYTWQRLSSWILLFGIIGHVVQMRFVEMPKKVEIGNQKQFLVKVDHDEGLDSLVERIHVKFLPNGGDYFSLLPGQVVVAGSTPGKAMLLMVRETFKSVTMCILYSVFVLAAAFHAFNGLWTSLITWGVILSYRSQKAMIPICWAGCVTLSFLGLAAIWGSYFINLRS